MQRHSRLAQVGTYLALIVAADVMLFPLLWMLCVSLKNPTEVSAYPITWIPRAPTLESYARVWTYGQFGHYFLNSVIVAGVSTLLCVGVAAPAAYGFSRFRYFGHAFLESTVLSTQMLPAILLVIPYFVLMRQVGLINTYPALWLIYTAFALPFCMWMLIGFFKGVPRDLDEAALIDGCGWFNAFRLVVLPLAVPGVAATTLFAFIASWKEYLFALVLTTDRSMYVVPVGIASLFGEHSAAWNDIMAAAVIATVPALIFYAFLDRYLVAGLTAGAVKG